MTRIVKIKFRGDFLLLLTQSCYYLDTIECVGREVVTRTSVLIKNTANKSKYITTIRKLKTRVTLIIVAGFITFFKDT